LSVGVKVALALFSSYTSGGGIDRDGNEITPMQVDLSLKYTKKCNKLKGNNIYTHRLQWVHS
jgi:hypothetical protein